MVVKGTEYFDGKTNRYVDFPITDVLQMMGRAGRPQFDDRGVAVILVHDIKKHFYKKFLYEPFPVESKYACGLLFVNCLYKLLPELHYLESSPEVLALHSRSTRIALT